MLLPAMSPEALVFGLVWSHSIQSLIALALGFAVAGAFSCGYQAYTRQPASFGLLEQPERNQALAAIPFLIFAAPFLIIRATLGSARPKQGNFAVAMIASFLAGFWSLMSGTLVVTVLGAAGILVA